MNKFLELIAGWWEGEYIACVPKPKKKPELKLLLHRQWYNPECVIGELFIDGSYVRECFILEDRDRLSKGMVKKHGETAIPRGTYEIRLTKSPRFKRVLPLLLSVPGFRGIRIHAGNTAKDTEGCLIPGQTKTVKSVGKSRVAFNSLFKKLQKAKNEGKRIVITIE